MHISTTREAILSDLVLGVKASDQRATIPILASVMLSAEGGWLDMTTTDMEVAVKSSVKCLIVEEGQCTIPVKPLVAFIKSLPKGSPVSMKTAADGLSVDLESGYRAANMATLPVTDFPTVKPGAFPVEFKIQASELHRIFRQVRPAISTEETRYYLCGIYLTTEVGEHGCDRLRAVTTDGHRLMLSDTTLPAPLNAKAMQRKDGGNWGIIIPRLTVSIIMDLIGSKPSGTILFRASDTRISARLGTQIVTSKLIDGTYPEYQRVIPREHPNVMTTDAADCISVVKSVVDAVSKDRSQAVRFDFTSAGVNLSSSHPDGGRSSSKLNGVTSYDGLDMGIGFQGRYVRELLGVIDGPVSFHMSDPGAPTVITADNEPRWLSVLMPVRV